jgi:hypothetical protein
VRALTGELLLRAWDAGTTEHSLNRALRLLSLGVPEGGRQRFAELSIAQRNRLLLQLRAMTFGPELKAFATCGHCATRMEIGLPIDEMLAQLGHTSIEPVEWQECGRQLRLRPVNTQDLLASSKVDDEREAQKLLLKRCSNLGDEPFLEESSLLVEAVLKKFDELHIGAELRCSVECPQCSASEMLDIDIATFFWLEVRHAAQRLLREIHLLAEAYGWSEASIVHMPQQRRNVYLEMARA